MPVYRAKPEEVRAFQWTSVSMAAEDMPEWFRPLFANSTILVGSQTLRVPAPGGPLAVPAGNWIIRKADGSYDFKAPEVFAATYEEAA
ncbi:MAG: hypothetical protein ACOY4R_27695 [Pseudomonadota bacterium]